jgi:predicted O-methyltransferase YrrM
MRSSYAINNYDAVFKSIVSAVQPTVCVELGVLEGYSAIAMASGLKENFEKSGGRGHLSAYDLFESYQFRNSPIEQTRMNIEAAGVADFVTLYQANAYGVQEEYQDNSVHLLHVDLSNTGSTIRIIIDAWDVKMVQGGIILFEGGTEERDNVEWMKKYDGAPIKSELENNPIIAAKYVFATYMKFPGLTCLLKKR